MAFDKKKALLIAPLLAMKRSDAFLLIETERHGAKVKITDPTFAFMIAPSVLSADFGNLQRDVEMINESAATYFHVDVMDGVYVPNISFGMPVIKAIKKHATKPLDVHLMIEKPERYIADFKKAGADILTVHYEASTHLHRTLQAIKAEGMQTGVALNTHKPVSVLEDTLQDIDLVLIMSVNPGFGGQSFIEQTMSKIKKLRAMIDAKGCKTLIEVDGGVNANNAGALKAAGADVLVAGSAVFKADDPKAMISTLEQA